MKRKLLCLLLILSMLPVQSLAYNAGTGLTSNSTATYSGKVSGGFSTGLALGIQTMDEREEYQVKSKNGNEADFKDGAEINNRGLANAARHFLYSYPDPLMQEYYWKKPKKGCAKAAFVL